MQLNQRLSKIDSFKKLVEMRILRGYYIIVKYDGFLSVNALCDLLLCLIELLSFLGPKHEELKEKLLSQKTLTINMYLEEIFGHVNILNLSLQSNDMNLVKAKYKLELWAINISNNKWSNFPKLQMQEVDEEKRMIIFNHLVFLHDNLNVKFHGLL